jgi:hypothetical protein
VTINNLGLTAVGNSVAAVMFALMMSCAAVGSSPGDAPVTSEAKARQIATAEFEKTTRSKIKKASIEKFEETKDQWTFRFVGKEEFARPGYHWHVTVDKKTGKAETISGE